jgi:NADPH-dependent 2,4-dienoyl-CoA reductase/sulfur reductase-like enzyme
VETAAEIVTAGQADLVAMTRAHLADPEVVRKAREGREREIRRCVGFNQGCVHRMLTGGMVTCTVNPVVGREAKWGRDHVSRTASPQNVVVVGGGPAGLKFAEAAGQRGHRVRLLEREGELGGQLRYAAMLPGRERWMHLSEDLEVSLDRLGVEVELGVEATAQDIIDDGADLVVVATGSHFATSGFSVFRQDRLGIPGADSSAVIDPVAAIRDPSAVGDSVVVIDEVGDTAGLGVAELLGLAGKEVHIVTMSPMVGQALASTFEVPSVLYPKLVAAGVEFHVWTTVESIGDGVASLRQVWTGEASDVDADTIVMNTHRVPEESLYRQLAEAGIQVRRIGDCVAPRQVDEAIYEAVALGFELQDSLVTQRPATLTGS